MTATGDPAVDRGAHPRPWAVPLRTAVLGAAGAVVFVATSTVDGWLRRGYHPSSMFVSELSIGPGGWVQRANFGVSGLLVVAFARAAATTAGTGRGRRAATRVLTLLGGCLAASALFTTDPSTMFSAVTVHGRVHALLGAVVFSCMPLSCWFVAVDLRDDGSAARMRRGTVATGIALVALVVLLKISELPGTPLYAWKGLVQRVDLVLFLGWLSVWALHLARRTRTGG